MIENTTVSRVAHGGAAVNDSGLSGLQDDTSSSVATRDARVEPTTSIIVSDVASAPAGIVRSSLLVVGAALMVMCASVAAEIAGWSALAERALSAPVFTGAVIVVFAIDHLIGRTRNARR